MAAKALHIFLAGLVAISSCGIVLNKHYCQAQLRKVALFVLPGSCHADDAAACHKNAKTCCQKKQGDKGKDDCCKDKSEYFHLDHEQQFQSPAFPVPHIPATAAVFWEKQRTWSSYAQKMVDYLHYKPPLIARDIPSLFQVYLL